jgi:hypothetical protein
MEAVLGNNKRKGVCLEVASLPGGWPMTKYQQPMATSHIKKQYDTTSGNKNKEEFEITCVWLSLLGLFIITKVLSFPGRHISCAHYPPYDTIIPVLPLSTCSDRTLTDKAQTSSSMQVQIALLSLTFSLRSLFP